MDALSGTPARDGWHRISTVSHNTNDQYPELQGFERINDGIQKGAYRHKFFIKGKKDLLDKIKRPQKLRHGGEASPTPHEDEEEGEEDEDAAKLQTIAAERLVGLSRTASGAADGNKSDDNKNETESKSEKEEEEE